MAFLGAPDLVTKSGVLLTKVTSSASQACCRLQVDVEAACLRGWFPTGGIMEDSRIIALGNARLSAPISNAQAPSEIGISWQLSKPACMATCWMWA